ncbi:MAG: hypothetical protein D3910_12835 [Candidatus Electrothrix sp. ATG2]|nr:hypothetical protein [Candidatus Electrothrix sp. ATG2]
MKQVRVRLVAVLDSIAVRADIPGNTVKTSGAVVAVGDGIAAVRAETGVSADDSGGFVRSGESAADQPGDAFAVRLKSSVIGKGTGTDGIGHSAALAGAVIAELDIRGGVGIVDTGQFSGIGVVAVGGCDGRSFGPRRVC